MPGQESNRRLSDLLVDPRETLEVELKGWLDIVGNNEHKATLAKALLALANHGGGFVVIGFEQTPQGVRPSPNRPADLSAFTPDTVNSIANSYADPTFHCDVAIESVGGAAYPIVSVPGGHSVPIRAKRAGPNGQIVRDNCYYIRRPGPQSETPQNAQEWDALIRRCISNARDDLLNQIRTIFVGGGTIASTPNDVERVTQWFSNSMNRWREVITPLPPTAGARFPNGHFAFAYQVMGVNPRLSGNEMLEALRRAQVRHTGWPEFWVPTRAEITPYMQDGVVECWLARDPNNANDLAHADFWRASPAGQLFLNRGYQEDAARDRNIDPGTAFDITLPTWRIGEAFLHASNMAREFGDAEAQVVLIAEWTGLRGRRLVAMGNPNRMLFDEHRAHQDTYRAHLTFRASQVSDSLPELVNNVIRPLYELFDFFQIPDSLIAEELQRMRSNRF